jgi:hypothetical protein
MNEIVVGLDPGTLRTAYAKMAYDGLSCSYRTTSVEA